jgi:hypothetical protein
MSQNITLEKNCKLKVLGIKDFYKIFLREKRFYAPSLFCVNVPTRKTRLRKVTFQEYKKVIYEYLKVYFFELYMNKQSLYFFLGGYMKVVSCLAWVRNAPRYNSPNKKQGSPNGSFGLFWYHKPSARMHYMLKLNKLSGSTNMITKIEKIFRENHNKDLLPIFTEEQKKGKKNKTLYRCIPT